MYIKSRVITKIVFFWLNISYCYSLFILNAFLVCYKSKWSIIYSKLMRFFVWSKKDFIISKSKSSNFQGVKSTWKALRSTQISLKNTIKILCLIIQSTQHVIIGVMTLIAMTTKMLSSIGYPRIQIKQFSFTSIFLDKSSVLW